MAKNNDADTLESGDYIKINGELHKVTGSDENTLTVATVGTHPRDYFQSGIDVGKITIC